MQAETGLPMSYLYGIVSLSTTLPTDMRGVENRSNVTTLVHDDLAAVVSEASISSYRGMTRDTLLPHLVAHQRVIEAVVQQQTILPVQFGTVLPAEVILLLLEQGAARFREVLHHFANTVQYEVVVLWEPSEVFEEIARDARVVRMKQEIAALSAAEQQVAAVELGAVVKELFEHRRLAIQERFQPVLRQVARDSILNPLMDDRMVANIALLIERQQHPTLVRTLDELDAQTEGRFSFRCVGPLPPHSFATLHVDLPVFEEIDAARRLLGLADTFTLAGIKHAYRRHAADCHPDQNPQHRDATDAMHALSQAAALLTRYAESHTYAEPMASCDTRREVVERTLLLRIVRHDETSLG